MIQSSAQIDKVLKTKVAIIGSGAAGAVLAYKLAKAGIDCVVLEEGDHYNKKDLSIPPLEIVKKVYRDSCFFSTLGKPIIPVPLGKCLGGTTVINSGTWFHTPEEKILSWQQNSGLTDLTPEVFAKSTEFIEGLIPTETVDENIMAPGNKKFKVGLDALDLKGKPLLRNTKSCDGCGYCCYGCPTQAKQSMDVSVIPLAEKLGAHFITNAKVEKITLRGGSVDHLVVSTNDGSVQKNEVKVIAERYVVAAGAIHSPALLIKSGINLKQVGNFLTIHPTTKVLAQFEDSQVGWQGIPQAYCYEGMKSEGITFEGVFLPPDVVGATLPYHGYKEILENYDKMGAFGALIHDSSYGRVKHFPLLGTKAFYSLTDLDTQKFHKAITFMARVYLKSGAKKVYAFVNRDDNVMQSEEDVKKFSERPLKNTDIESMGFHPLGTCRMGLDKNDSVVDQNSQVHGIDNLFVCDGSVIPTALGVNPQLTIMNFASRLGGYLASL